MPFFLRIINDHSRLHQNTLLLHHTHGWERISGMWPINSSKNLHHIKSIVTGLLQRRVFIYNTHAHTHGHTQIALPPRPTSLGSDWLTRRVKRKRWKVIWVDSLNAIFMVCSDKVILTQAHTAIMHVHFFFNILYKHDRYPDVFGDWRRSPTHAGPTDGYKRGRVYVSRECSDRPPSRGDLRQECRPVGPRWV